MLSPIEDLEKTEKRLKKTLTVLSGVLFVLIFPVIFFLVPQKYMPAAISSVSVTVLSVPSVASSASLNGGSAVNLTEGTTTSIAVTGTVTDNNGCADLTSVTVLAYLDGATCNSSGDADNDNCYVFTDSSPGGGCTDITYTVNHNFSLQFYAAPGTWKAKIVPAGGYGTGTSSTSAGVALNDLQALGVSNLDYGSLNPGAKSTGSGHTVTATNTGNATVDFKLSGTDLSCSGGGIGSIPVANQKYGLSTFEYDTGGTVLSGTASSALGANIAKRTQTSGASTGDVYWQIYVPNGVLGTCSGTTTFTIAS